MRTPPLYFAAQNTGEEVNTFLYIVFVFHPCVVVAIGGEPEETTVCEERDWKDFISFLAVGGNPSVLADTSPIASPHPAMLRGTAGEVFKNISDSKN